MISKVIFALFIAAASASPYKEVSPDFVCPEEDIAATSCMGPKDCLYPNPDSCTSFIHCEVNADNKTGTPTIQDCPADLEWNDNTKECDYPGNSTCKSGGTTTEQPTSSSSSGEPDTTTQASEETSAGQPSSSEPTTAEPTTSSTEPSSSTSSPAPTSTEGSSSTDNGSGGSDFVCPEKDIAETGCMGPTDCMYPNPGNCETFIKCTVNADNKTGTPVIMDCPSGLQWNDNTKRCDYPENSTCPDKGTSAQPSSSTTSSPEPTTTTTQSSEETTTSKSTTEEPTTTSTPEETTTEQGTTTEKATTTEEPTTTPQSTTTTQCVCTTTTTTITTTTTTTSSPEPTTTESSTTSEATTSEATTSEATTSEATTSEATTSEATTSEASTTTTQSPSSTQPPSGGNFVCPPEDIINTKCLGPKDCLYQNNNDCSTFIQCTVNPGGVTGTPVVMPCSPGGTLWNDNIKQCDWPANTTCPKRKVW